MKVLVVIAHPNPKSFNHAILEEFTRGLRDGGHTYEVIDLCAIKFDPVFKLTDYGQFFTEDVPKDVLESWKPKEMIISLAGGPIKRFMAKMLLRNKDLSDIVELIGKHTPKDVLEHQKKVANAEALVLIFPVYWNNFPAILLGWLQRVFTHGFAYNLSEKGWQGDIQGRLSLLKHKKALLINTTFFKEEDFKERGFKDAMEKIMAEYAFKYPGIPDVEYAFFYSVYGTDEKTRNKYLETAYHMGKEF